MPKIPYKGVEVDAEDVDFSIVHEDWNTYQLHDGTEIRMRHGAVGGRAYTVEHPRRRLAELHFYYRHTADEVSQLVPTIERVSRVMRRLLTP